MRILLIEDDTLLGGAVREQLTREGHAIDWVQRIADAETGMRGVDYDLVLLDLMLPDGSGLEFLRTERARGTTAPVIILTARDRISERIEGLNAGADDYLVKPFDLSELTARIDAVSRRYGGNPNPVVQLGNLEIDIPARSVRRDGRNIDLTAREWRLLEVLLAGRGAVLSKSRLEEHLYGFDDEFASNTVEVHVSRLRKKLGHDLIETVRGVGYRIGEP